MLLSAMLLIDFSEKAETGGESSDAANVAMLLVDLFLENKPRNPPLDSNDSPLLGFNGIRPTGSSVLFRWTGGGRGRLLNLEVGWGLLNR